MTNLTQEPAFQSALLDILDTTQEMMHSVSKEELDMHELSVLTTKREELMLDFQSKYSIIIQKSNQAHKNIFSKIYDQLLKKQRELDDTIDIKLSYIKKQMAEMRKEREQRTQYAKAPAHKARASSVFITSKLHG